MIDFEEYEIKYTLFLAEQDLYTDMINIGGSCLYEAVGLISIQEALKDTVTKYITKIKDALEKAFEKFKNIVAGSAIGKFVDSIKGKIAESKGEFTVKNYYEYNIQKLQSIKTVPLDMDRMKDSLQSKEQFIKDYYQELSGEGSIKDNIERLVKSEPKDIHADGNLFTKSADFITKTIPAEVTNIRNEINAWINASKTLETVADAGQGVDTTQTEAVSLYESCILEAEGDEPKTEIVPDEGSEKSDKGKAFTKTMTTYTGVTIDILTAKMSIYKDIFNQHMRILTYQFGKPKQEEEKQNI